MKKIQLLVLGLCVVALFQGCDNKSSETTSSEPQKKLRLAFVANTADDYWSIVQLGCGYAAPCAVALPPQRRPLGRNMPPREIHLDSA